MKTIIVKTQAELDALPTSFAEYTQIKIQGGDRFNKIQVTKKWDNSSVVARDNSSVVLFSAAYAIILSSSVIVKKLMDFSIAVFRGCPARVEEKSNTAMVREIPGAIEVSFDEWLKRGYVRADGITKKLLSQKKLGEVEVFEVQEFPKKISSYVVKRGNIFSHGETIEKAIADLRYKIADRDTSKFEHWKKDLDQKITLDEAIAAYRTITGACELGTKQFVESIQVPSELTPKIVLEITKDKYGNDKFQDFLKRSANSEAQ